MIEDIDLGGIPEAYLEDLDRQYESNSHYGSDIINEIYQSSLPLIQSVASRYLPLTAIHELNDFLNAGYEALIAALNRYSLDTGMKFSTFYVWYLQKHFSEMCPVDEKHVLVRIDDEVTRMPYSKFQKVKRKLPRNAEWIVESRFIPYDPFENQNGDPAAYRNGYHHEE